MATTSSQIKRTYQNTLANSKEKKDPRHGLACEYLTFWMWENICGSLYEKQNELINLRFSEQQTVYSCASGIFNREEFILSDYISRPIIEEKRYRGRTTTSIKGYADVLFGSDISFYFLGEVKITPQSAEEILQQIKFYGSCIELKGIVIALDFDCPQLARITEGTNITVVRLGEKFELFTKSRIAPQILEI